MRQTQTGFIPIIVAAVAVVLLIGAGGTAYYFIARKPANLPVSQSPGNETNGWQEYVNPKYGYKIKYPPDWFFHKTGYNPPPPAAIQLSNVDEALGYDANQIILEVISLPAPGENLQSNAEIKSLVGDGFSKKSMALSGEPAMKLEKENNEGGVDTSFYIYHKGNVYRLGWNLGNAEVRRLNETTLQKIIGTFVFTD